MNDHGLRHPGRREAVAAVVVAAVVLLVAWLFSGSGDGPSPADRALLTSGPNGSEPGTQDAGDPTREQVSACLTTPTFASGPDDVAVLYFQVQRTQAGNQPVLVLRNEAGELRLCDSFGADAPSVAPIDWADAEDPVTFLSNGRQTWNCDGSRMAAFAMSHWLSVADPVDRVQLRFLVDGVPGTWFSSRPENGIVHLHAWLGPQSAGAVAELQVQVLDRAGNAVEQSAFGPDPQPLSRCQDAGLRIG